jgi:hypothetical protein
MIKSELALAFAVETAYRPETAAVTMINERLQAVAVDPTEVISVLHAKDDLAGVASPAPDSTGMVVAWDCLRHAFRPRTALDQICSRLHSGGRLIYAQRLTDQYLGLTAKWLLDYFITARYADCRIYVLWTPEHNPAIATFDYKWMIEQARPVYNPMWDNITYAEAVVVVAEKAAESRPGLPSQDIYRPPEEWELYTKALARLAASPRPWHLTGPLPDRLPPRYRPCSELRSTHDPALA